VSEEILNESGVGEEALSVSTSTAPTEAQLESQIPLIVKLSALLFVAVKPVTVEWLSEVSRHEVGEIEEALIELSRIYTYQENGFALAEVAGGYQFRTAPQLASILRRVVPVKVKRLSRAAAETLAVVAYKQPVERAEIESIRGVDALPTLKTLLDAKLIRVIGKQDTPGQPVLYGTTTTFLERFGLRDLASLPSLHEFEQLLEEPGEGSESGEGDSGSVVSELAEGSLEDEITSREEDLSLS
jgi:segregation and condensation protein B